METTLSVINLMPSNKAQIEQFKSTIKSEILANETNPLPILVQLKMAEKTISEILKDDDIDEHFLKEYFSHCTGTFKEIYCIIPFRMNRC